MRAEPLLVMDSRVCGTLKIRAKRGKGETLCLEFEKLEYFFLDIYVVHGMKQMVPVLWCFYFVQGDERIIKRMSLRLDGEDV